MACWRGLLLGVGVFLLAAQHPVSGSFLGTDQNQVVQFGAYDAMLEECFYEKLFATMPNPQTVSFVNPAAKAIAFVSVEADQGKDFGGITPTIAAGTIGTSTFMTIVVAASPASPIFLDNVTVRMFCKK